MHTTYAVSGMTCEHCANAVREEVAEISGVDAVSVDLAPGGTSKVAVTSELRLTDAQVADALAEAGDYTLVRTDGPGS